MKRVWEINHFYTGEFLNWGFSICLPNSEDYFNSHYTINIIFFGFKFTISTWKD